MKLLPLVGLVLLAVFAEAFESEHCQSEVVLALDLSQTISEEELNFIKIFSKNVGKELAKNKENRVGIASFSETATTNVACSSNPIDVDVFSKQVDQVNKMSEIYTNIEAGITEARDILSRPGCSLSRPGRHIILLVSDGNGNYGYYSKLLAKAQAIREQGIQIFSIGIQNESYKPMILENISGYKEYVYPVQGFESLMNVNFQEIISLISCNPRKPPTPTPATTTTTTKKPTTTTTTTTTTKKPTTTTTTTTTKKPTTTAKKPTTTTTTKKPTTTTTTTTTTKKPTTTTKRPTTTKATTKRPVPDKGTCECKMENTFFPCLSWNKADILANFEGDCPRDKFKKALEYIHKRAMAITEKLLAFRHCQKKIQNHIIIQSVEESAPSIDSSPALQHLFSKEEQCAFNIRGRLMKWKIQLMTVKKMIEHEIIFEEEGFHSAFDSVPSGHMTNSEMLKKLMMMKKK